MKGEEKMRSERGASLCLSAVLAPPPRPAPQKAEPSHFRTQGNVFISPALVVRAWATPEVTSDKRSFIFPSQQAAGNFCGILLLLLPFFWWTEASTQPEPVEI